MPVNNIVPHPTAAARRSSPASARHRSQGRVQTYPAAGSSWRGASQRLEGVEHVQRRLRREGVGIELRTGPAGWRAVRRRKGGRRTGRLRAGLQRCILESRRWRGAAWMTGSARPPAARLGRRSSAQAGPSFDACRKTRSAPCFGVEADVREPADCCELGQLEIVGGEQGERAGGGDQMPGDRPRQREAVKVEVPRPISSSRTRLLALALCRMWRFRSSRP